MDLMFYHLERQPLESVLPLLLEKTRERGWRAVVEVSGEARKAALDDVLWTYSERSFLPHGPDGEPGCEDQPILITAGGGNSNAAEIRFVVDGARLPDDLSGYERIAVLFDGNDPVALDAARADWKRAKAAGLAASYWQQNGDGRWEKKA
ncbi:MAG: DNA polymerase III subunit chi [Beijerinckiaceae bacterium]|nr:DNA polymerase III subunit chi [Beijerinckiaceae bacterium]